MLDLTPQSVKGALARARAALEGRVPERERAPLQLRLTRANGQPAFG
jgi:hypothetical protein